MLTKRSPQMETKACASSPCVSSQRTKFSIARSILLLSILASGLAILLPQASGQTIDSFGFSQDLLATPTPCNATGPMVYRLPITNVQRTGATTEKITVSNDSFGNVRLFTNNKVHICNTSDDGGSFNTPANTTEVVSSVSAGVVTLTMSGARGTNPFSSTPDSGTLVFYRFYPWEDTTGASCSGGTGKCWWIGDSLGYSGWLTCAIQNDPSLTASQYGFGENSVIATKYVTGVTANTTLNRMDRMVAQLHRMGFNCAGEYTAANYRPFTNNAAWGTSDNLPPVADRMPTGFQFQNTTYPAVDLNHNSTQCGLAHCYTKDSHANEKKSVSTFANFDRGCLDVWDPNWYDLSTGFMAGYIQNDSSIALFYRQQGNHDYLAYVVLDESDVGCDTGAGGEFGYGALTAPKNGLPPTASGNWTNGGLVTTNTPSGHQQLNPGATAEILATVYRVGAHPCNDVRPSQNSCSNAGNINLVYDDPLYHTKAQLNCWLQANCSNEQQTNVACTGASNTVTCTLGAANVGYGPTHFVNVHDVPALTSCTDPSFNTPSGFQNEVLTMNASTGVITFTLNGVGASATCTFNLGPRYATIAALNAAWCNTSAVCAAYTTFGSAETVHSGEVWGSGDGSTKTFAHTLSNASNYSPCSLQIYVGGVVEAGDPCDGTKAASPSTTNNLITNEDNATTGHGTIITNTAVATVTFLNAPPSGTNNITANYSNGGWGIGCGILDEDFKNTSCSTWLTSGVVDLYTLSGLNSTAKLDWDNFHFYATKQYLAVMNAQVHKWMPGVMVLAEDPIGGYSVSANPESIQAVCEYTDILAVPGMPNEDPSAATSDSQARMDVVSANCGDKPWMNFLNFTHVTDSFCGASNTTCQGTSFTSATSSAPDFFSGNDLATYYDSYLNSMITTVTGGVHPFVGALWLQADHQRLGLWSYFFDLYDGKQAIPSASVDDKGNPTGCMPISGATIYCEPNKSNDMVTGIAHGNQRWLSLINRRQTKVNGAPTFNGPVVIH